MGRFLSCFVLKMIAIVFLKEKLAWKTMEALIDAILNGERIDDRSSKQIQN
jgi:hypothetical protein